MSAWKAKILASSSPRLTVLQQVHALFEQQRATWDLFCSGEAALAGMRTKCLTLDNHRHLVQANPGRTISTSAKTDPASVAGRPCFLCPENIPLPERGIAFGNYIILPNPYPIMRRHTTIALREHRPQLIDGRISDLLALAEALGPEMFVLYNGARCGASAPDHLHFQAGESAGVPLFDHLPIGPGATQVTPCTIGGRNLLACSFGYIEQAQSYMESMISALKNILDEHEEPMINILALYRDNRYIVYLFPRKKHRSACYYDIPQRQIAISPGSMEMAGLIVVADSSHFDRVDVSVVQSMFEEVTLENDRFNQLKKALL